MLTRDIGQCIDRGELWWTIEGACRTCANVWCEQGTGAASPDEIREALLAAHGPARLRIVDAESSLVPVLRALREMLHLSLHEARAMATTLKETGLVGTLVEMQFIADGLQRRSVATAIETDETQAD
ncbi:hypothetical protein [Streptomyces sp. NPDC059479]|uniref:hypothetical protein n=1 Tax=Streptomyces sp. NPDC059479 TaxID=3346848 RepID=UPI0036A30110